MNAYDRIEQLCDQWESNASPLPPDARHLLRKVVRQVVLDAAAACDRRASVAERPIMIRSEATKCGAQIRHELLCQEGESVCLLCDGDGCPHCDDGIKRTAAPQAEQSK